MNTEERPSKTQRKREMHELQAIGESLIDMPAADFDALPVPDALRDAVLAARRMTSRGALHRQRQYIGKVMRTVDTGPLRAAMAARAEHEKHAALAFRRIERWRDRLLDEGDGALPDLLEAWPAADRQHLRRMVLEAQRARAAGRPPAAARKLFRYLQRLMTES